MARNKVFKFVEPKYYAYYDKKTGEILSVSNEASSIYKNKIEITEQNYSFFLTGIQDYANYKVGYIKNDAGLKIKSLIPRKDFHKINKIFLESVYNEPNPDNDLLIVWNSKMKAWQFRLTDKGKDKLINEEVVDNTLHFFVTWANDPNFLIRTIKLNILDLKQNSSIVEFVSSYEHSISDVNILTYSIFDNYGLVIA